MHRAAAAGAALAAAAALLVGGAGRAAGPGFADGVAAGEVTASGAFLWTRAPRAGALTVELSRDAALKALVASRPAAATAARDLTVTVPVTGLAAGTVYHYRFRQGASLSPVGTFRTAPPAASTAPVRFAVSGDADATAGPTGGPAFGSFDVYAAMAAEHNDFDVNLGDTIYSDSEVPGSPPATTVAAKRAKYRLNLAAVSLTTLRASAGVYNHWDDHEFLNDFSRAELGDGLYRAGVEAFTEYMPARWTAADGLYRTFRWGRDVELFFLDERSFRSAKASANHRCDSAGRPDLAPTAPQAVRTAFAALVPALASPPPAACVAAITDPSRTMLGARQLARFEHDVAASTATFKVILNEVPIQQLYALPYDRWEGYAAERTKLLTFLQHVRNVVFLTTDTHATFVNTVRLRTLEPGGPVDTGMLEAVTGPVGTNTFSKEIDAAVGTPGDGVVINALFFKPAPPKGVGMLCAQPDAYSYSEVTVTSRTLTIAPRDAAGRPLADFDGAPCGPFAVTAR